MFGGALVGDRRPRDLTVIFTCVVEGCATPSHTLCFIVRFVSICSLYILGEVLVGFKVAPHLSDMESGMASSAIRNRRCSYWLSVLYFSRWEFLARGLGWG